MKPGDIVLTFLPQALVGGVLGQIDLQRLGRLRKRLANRLQKPPEV